MKTTFKLFRSCLVTGSFLISLTVMAMSSQRDKNEVSVDKSGINKRDSDFKLLTADEQMMGTEEDVQKTRVVRRAITKDSSLSVNAHNIKIVSLNGKMTLRGPVNSKEERRKIEEIASKAAGNSTIIRNRLEITK